jgi:hypothetical protein
MYALNPFPLFMVPANPKDAFEKGRYCEKNYFSIPQCTFTDGLMNIYIQKAIKDILIKSSS